VAYLEKGHETILDLFCDQSVILILAKHDNQKE